MNIPLEIFAEIIAEVVSNNEIESIEGLQEYFDANSEDIITLEVFKDE